MFWKKKKMIDIRELQKQRAKVIPSLASGSQTANTESTTESTGNFFSFMDNPTSSTSSSSSSTTPLTSESGTRKISSQISALDNKLYKLEQRLELLEKKLGVS